MWLRDIVPCQAHSMRRQFVELPTLGLNLYRIAKMNHLLTRTTGRLLPALGLVLLVFMLPVSHAQGSKSVDPAVQYWVNRVKISIDRENRTRSFILETDDTKGFDTGNKVIWSMTFGKTELGPLWTVAFGFLVSPSQRGDVLAVYDSAGKAVKFNQIGPAPFSNGFEIMTVHINMGDVTPSPSHQFEIYTKNRRMPVTKIPTEAVVGLLSRMALEGEKNKRK